MHLAPYFVVRLVCVILLTSSLLSAARRSVRTADSHQDAQQLDNTAITALEESADAREAFLPRGFVKKLAPRRAKVTLQNLARTDDELQAKAQALRDAYDERQAIQKVELEKTRKETKEEEEAARRAEQAKAIASARALRRAYFARTAAEDAEQGEDAIPSVWSSKFWTPWNKEEDAEVAADQREFEEAGPDAIPSAWDPAFWAPWDKELIGRANLGVWSPALGQGAEGKAALGQGAEGKAAMKLTAPVAPSGRAWEQGWTQKAAEGTKQDFLEADPYYSKDDVPVNTYKAKKPYTAKIVSVNRMVGPKSTGETCHIVIDHGGKMPYYEGQSYGVIAPVMDTRTGKPAKTRLYSIASSRYGDDMTGNTASLCVRRATYWCPEMQAEDPAKKGVCSNFLCDAKPGDEVQLTGPSGKVMLMPEEDPNTDLIMIATGTGIAPYRGFIRRNFLENTPACDKYSGLAWLFLGVANSDGLLYDDEFQQVLKDNPNNFRVNYALSREGDNKMYIQDTVAEYGSEIFDRMENGAHLYMCGLKGMLPGVTETLQKIAKSKGQEWDNVLKKWKKGGQWHIEVY